MDGVDALLDKVMVLCPLVKAAEIFRSGDTDYLAMTAYPPICDDRVFMLALISPELLAENDEATIQALAEIAQSNYDAILRKRHEEVMGGFLFGPFPEAETLGSRQR